ncbi:MAG: dethiobiotin synthase [Verrucomicrobiia bacterium]
MGQIIFVAGTDTGAGKTLLTALLLTHLRRRGCHALAIKPFSTGNRKDARILYDAQDRELSIDELNPFHFGLPVAPLAAARAERRSVALSDLLERVRVLSSRCDLLLVEGAGGLLVPLGEGYTVADVIASLRCPVILAARNKLGIVNHALLSLALLRSLPAPSVQVVLMDQARLDHSSEINEALIIESTSTPAEVESGCKRQRQKSRRASRWVKTSVTVARIPFLGPNADASRSLKKNAKKLQKTLARISELATFSTAFGDKQQTLKQPKKTLARFG